MRPIPIIDSTDTSVAETAARAGADRGRYAGLQDPQLNRATVFATLAVTFLWFALAITLMWLAAALGTGSLSGRYLALGAAFAVVSLALFVAAVAAGGPPRQPSLGVVVFVGTLVAIVAATWLGALVELRWVVLPVSYGVGIALTRYFRQVPVPVSVALRP